MDPKICPYLGLVDDPNTSTSFPYEGNACYRAKKPTPVALSHQRGYCLSDEHTHCPGYINGWAGGFPKSLQARQPVLQKVFQSKLAWASLGVIILISLWFIFPQEISAVGNNLYTSVSGWFDRPAVTEAADTPTPTNTGTSLAALVDDTHTTTYTLTSTHTETVTPTNTVTSTPTETGTPTRTATPTRGITYVIPTNTKKPPPQPTQPPPPTATQPPPPTPVPPTDTPVPTPTRP